MIEFDRWWKTQEGKWSLICCPAVAKKSWRQALKWAKAVHDRSSEPRFSLNIREELQDGSS